MSKIDNENILKYYNRVREYIIMEYSQELSDKMENPKYNNICVPYVKNCYSLRKTIPYTATGFGKFIAGVTSYTVTYKDTNGDTQSVVIDGDNLTATFCAVEDSVSNTPANTPLLGVNYIVSTEACDEGCSSIDDATLNQILETLEKKY